MENSVEIPGIGVASVSIKVSVYYIIQYILAQLDQTIASRNIPA